MQHLFGRTLTVNFYPQAKDEDVSAYQLVSARIYPANTYPTDAQQENLATGHIGEKTSWQKIALNGFKVLFDPIVDATPHTSTEYETYYVVFNYRYESGGEVKFDVEQIFVYRPDSHTSTIEVTAEDVYKLDSRLKVVAPTPLWMEDMIQIAVDDIVAALEGRGYEKKKVFNWQKMNGAATRLAAAYACSDRAGESNQFWMRKAERWETRAWKMYETALIGFDVSGGDRPGVDDKRFTGAVSLVR